MKGGVETSNITLNTVSSSCLSCNRLDGLPDRFLIAKELHRDNRFHVLVKLVDEGDAGGQVEPHDVLVGHVVQVLHYTTQRVPVGGDDDLLASLQMSIKSMIFFLWED